MASLKSMRENPKPVRMLLTGYPKAGKTGSLVSLANAGYKLRVIDFEGNYDPLVNYSDPRADIDVVNVQDDLSLEKGDRFIGPKGTPEAYNRAVELARQWRYKDKLTGEMIDLGNPSKDWDASHILVVDSLTAMAEAAFDRALAYNNSTPKYVPPAVYGAAVGDLTRAIKLFGREDKPYHLIVIGHLRMIGPDDYLKMDEKDDKLHADLKPIREAKLEAIDADLLPVRLYPWAVTKNQSPVIHKEFSSMLLVEQANILNKPERIIRTRTTKPIDLGFPAKAPEFVKIENGLATLFETLGHKAPGLK